MNIKHGLKIALLLCISANAFAQNTDSLAFSKFDWQKQNIAKNTVLSRYHVKDSSLFNAKLYISFIEVKKGKKSPEIGFGYEKQKLIKSSDFGKKNNAIALVNGTFFNMKAGSSVDFLKVNDTIINQTIIQNNKRALHQKSAILIHKGLVSIAKWDETDGWENRLKAENIMVSGPLLISNHQKENFEAVSFNTNRHPRTAIGVKPNGNVILLTIDGRSNQSYGSTMHELAAVMKWLGCSEAINLDGGGSTTMWINVFGENGVVNYPSDNKKWDHEGERPVANIIFLRNKSKR